MTLKSMEEHGGMLIDCRLEKGYKTIYNMIRIFSEKEIVHLVFCLEGKTKGLAV